MGLEGSLGRMTQPFVSPVRQSTLSMGSRSFIRVRICRRLWRELTQGRTSLPL